ncbi:hypothetical protein HPB50_007205 [Hyalomma asiaticum]|uniref:Uncharacterized protein n=1 Tax=Hyalomma asiaticum TaxID=266040 RepID=A0ACB7TJS8_HYAAI|nr:hypothetical protein HPB50_007205 [Hyalomma asiaticum]
MASSTAAWMYSEAKRQADYHEEMDGNRFEPERREIGDDGLEEGRGIGVAHKQKHHLREKDDKEAAA